MSADRRSRRQQAAEAAAQDSPRGRLVAAARGGAVTLILGAGVSIELGVPNWHGLAVRVWQRALAGAGDGTAADVAAVEQPAAEPQLFPIIFELAQARLGTRAFIETLRECLYDTARNARQVPDTTLGAIADAIARDHTLGARRRIARVISLNADELLRESLRRHNGEPGKQQQWFRTMDHVVSELPLGRGEQPVPIYHVHGFLPRPGAFAESRSEHRLVFTDSQYWESGTSQASLANRTMNAALADSHCVFIGLSMTDQNLLRWLALRYNEMVRDVTYQTRSMLEEIAHGAADTASAASPPPTDTPEQIDERLRHRLAGHFWIRTPDADRSGLLSQFLLRRGVEAVEIPSWHDGSLPRLLEACFPNDD